MNKIFYLTVIVSIIVSGCLCASEMEKTTGAQMQQSDDNNQRYYFEMSKSEVDKFLSKVRKLKIGSTVEDVIQVLGKPDYNTAVSRKEDTTYRGRSLTYYLKIWRKDLVNEIKDCYVDIKFDKNDKLTGYNIVSR